MRVSQDNAPIAISRDASRAEDSDFSEYSLRGLGAPIPIEHRPEMHRDSELTWVQAPEHRGWNAA